MRRVFNLGVGLIAVAGRGEVDEALRAAKTAAVDTWIIGEVRAGTTGVRFAER